MTNCKNCGAPLFVDKDECPYCKTAYYKHFISNEIYDKYLRDERTKVIVDKDCMRIYHPQIRGYAMRDMDGRLI